MSGSTCLLTQLKRKANAVTRTVKNFDLKFKFQLLDSLLLGKIRYNLATWVQINMKLKNKINNVKKLTKNDYLGRSVEYIMREHKILDYFQLHQNTRLKQTFSILNKNEKNFATFLLKDARTIRNTAKINVAL